MKSLFLGLLGFLFLAPGFAAEVEIRVGMVGLDTSHAPAFTKILNAGTEEHGVKVVAGVPEFSPDIESSVSRIDKFVETLTNDYSVTMYESIEEMLPHVDVVMIESVDGRPHLEQATPGIVAGKPTFIDKPAAASLEDVVAIFDLAKKHGTPVWSSSNLRYHSGVVSAATTDVGEIVSVISYGPASLEPNHLDLAWYGIHSTEALYTVLGTGCVSVSRTYTEGTDVVTGLWEGGKTGTLLGLRKSKTPFGLQVFGTQQVITESAGGAYPELMEEMVKFFQTGKTPISPEVTIELFAFMAAADESKERNGAPVTIEEMLEKARASASSE